MDSNKLSDTVLLLARWQQDKAVARLQRFGSTNGTSPFL
jgi:hypothetical protein